MFLLTVLPESLIHSMLLFGLVGVVATTFFSMIPFIGRFLKQIQVIAIALLVAAVYLEGGMSVKHHVQLNNLKAEVRVSQKETKAAETTTKIVTEYVDRVKIIKEKGDTVYVEVPKIITKYDSTCQLPNAFLRLYDSSIDSSAEVPGATGVVDEEARTTDEASIIK